MNEIVIYKNDLNLAKSNVVRRAMEKRALQVLLNSNQIDENTYSKLQNKIKVKYAKRKAQVPHLTM